MAVRTFYGTCKTASGDSEKKVYVPNLDLTAGNNGFNFQEGDLLIVFFAQTNTVSEPSIVIYIQDPEVEISTTSDIGKYIKSLDVEANMENAWAAGETVIFAYTQLSTENTYYWELIDAFHASIDTYGNTKLFDDEQLNNLLAGTYSGDIDIALTPNTLKKFYDLFDSEDEESPLKLKWVPESEEGSTQQTLGRLSLTNNTSGVNITYPLEEEIAEYFSTHQNITHTGQLINNGNGNGENHETEESEPFITRIIPDNLYFNNENGLYYGNDPATAQPRIILNDAADALVLGNTNDQTLMGITINKSTEVFGNLKTNGQLIAIPETPEQATNAVGITTNGVIREKNTALSERYSPKLQVKKYTHVTGKIPKGTTSKVGGSAHIHIPVNLNGWTPIGVVGYNVNYVPPNNTGDALFANVWECYLISINGVPNIEYSIYNLRGQDINVQIDVYVLYTKNI